MFKTIEIFKICWKVFLTEPNGSQDILCGNVTKFSMAKNGYADRNLHTIISLELNFYVSSSLNFRDFSVWKSESKVLCTARNVQSVSANLKTFC